MCRSITMPVLLCLIGLIGFALGFGILAHVARWDRAPASLSPQVNTKKESVESKEGGQIDQPKVSEKQDEGKEDQPIVGLALQGQYVFASTETGLFRANKDQRIWQAIHGKTTPEPGGTFVTRGPEDANLFYYVTLVGWQETARIRGESGNAGNKKRIQRPGLYRSRDAGDTWERVDGAHDFLQMLWLPSGRLFATTTTEDKEELAVLLSEDEGRTWKDITNGVSKHSWRVFLKRDPEHAQRVWVYAPFSMRIGGTIYHAENDQFLWEVRYAELDVHRWPPDPLKTEREFFETDSYLGYQARWPVGTVESLPDFPQVAPGSFGANRDGVSSGGSLCARLDNYFAYPFGDRVRIPPFDVIPEKTSYEFRRNEPMPVRVSLVSYTADPLPTLLDSPDAALFWASKAIGPSGWKWSSELRFDPLGHLKDENKAFEQSLKEHKIEPFQLTIAKAHQQTIDLRGLGLCAFDLQGQYKIQLIYSCGCWRDSAKVMRYLDPVAGQVFSVTITP